jgi:hypothetical protein
VVADSDYSRYFAVGTNGDLYIQQPLNINDPKPPKYKKGRKTDNIEKQ